MWKMTALLLGFVDEEDVLATQQDSFTYVGPDQIPAAFSGLFASGEDFGAALRTLVPRRRVSNDHTEQDVQSAQVSTALPQRRVARRRKPLSDVQAEGIRRNQEKARNAKQSREKEREK